MQGQDLYMCAIAQNSGDRRWHGEEAGMEEVSRDGVAHGPEEDHSASCHPGRGLAGGSAGVCAGGCLIRI